MVEVDTVDSLRVGLAFEGEMSHERMVEVVPVDSLRVTWIWVLDLRLLGEVACGGVVPKCSIWMISLGIVEYSGSFVRLRFLS